jgi:hypothetical protein
MRAGYSALQRLATALYSKGHAFIGGAGGIVGLEASQSKKNLG